MSSDDDVPDLVPGDYYEINLLDDAIKNSDIDAVKTLFTVSHVNSRNICDILYKPELYSVLESLLKNDAELCEAVCKILTDGWYIIYRIARNITVPMLNIVLSYLSFDEFLQEIFNQAVSAGNLQVLDTLFASDYDMKLAFDKTDIFNFYNYANGKYEPNIIFSTFVHLGKLGINIVDYVNIVCMDFCYSNDVTALVFCFDNGINVDDVFSRIDHPITIEIIDCLLQYGANLNKLTLYDITRIMYHGTNWPVILYLIKNGLDTSNYLYELLTYCVKYSLDAIKYFVNLGVDIDIINKLLWKACKYTQIECVVYLLENGSDIHYKNNSILNLVHYSINSHNNNWMDITKLLIKHGAVPNDLMYTFCLYIIMIRSHRFDVELFTYFLNTGINPNNKFDLKIKDKYVYEDNVEYILDAIVYVDKIDLLMLCLEYGADPYINNHSPLKLAIKMNRLEFINLLLKLGSIVDPDLDYCVNIATIDLLDQYQINHKLKKIDR